MTLAEQAGMAAVFVTLALIALRMAHVIRWAWWWLALPIAIYIIAVVVLVVFLYMAMVLGGM